MSYRPRSQTPPARSGALDLEQPRGPPPERPVYTIARLNREAKDLLEHGFGLLLIEAEVSNLVQHSSGHWYFSLKDETAQVRCAMFRGANQKVRMTVRSGLLVRVRARVSLYEARGEFQLVVESMEDAGEGALRRRIEELKAKLAAEGLFDVDRKRALPRLPRRLGIVTSPSGAAVRDILKVLARRFPAIPVLIYPAAVQGAGAAAELCAAVELASARREVDVLIIARGGGSIEDLMAFNDEALARKIAACPMPVISGVGHEIDFTITDLVADLRAPTPSGAAELAVPDRAEWLRALAGGALRLAEALTRQLTLARRRAGELAARLDRQHPGQRLLARAQRVDELNDRLVRALAVALARSRAKLDALRRTLDARSPRLLLRARQQTLDSAARRLGDALRHDLTRRRSRLELTARALGAVSPLATLSRGYAIIRTETGAVVTDAGQLSVGSTLRATLERGALEAVVTKTTGLAGADGAD